jgi:hypothetical protein
MTANDPLQDPPPSLFELQVYEWLAARTSLDIVSMAPDAIHGMTVAMRRTFMNVPSLRARHLCTAGVVSQRASVSPKWMTASPLSWPWRAAARTV